MSGEPVIAQVVDRVGVITLNRPTRRNAFNPAMREALRRHLEAVERDPAASVILIRGEGRSFCAGYDLTSDDPDTASLGTDPLRWHAFQDQSLELLLGIWGATKPVVAAVQGHALGFGCVLATICDLTIAADDALFGEPEIRFQSMGSVVLLPWIVGVKRARELLYMGDMIDARTALEYGMVNRVVPTQDLPRAAERYARRLALVGSEALARAKLAVNRGLEAGGFRNALHAGLDVISPLYTVDTATARAFRADVERLGLREALKRRNADFE
jgi:enoyl-CoA hydratase/carnithine racemase